MSDAAGLLTPAGIVLNATAADRDDAIRVCGKLLVDIGAVSDDYVATMLERETSVSTYVGEGVAIPHGTLAGKDAVISDALAVVRFPSPVDWGGNPVSVCVAIAARGDGHIGLLAALAEILLDPVAAGQLRDATSTDDVIRLLAPVGKDNTA